MKETIGQKLSPVLEEIERTLWESEADERGAPEFTDKGFRAAIKIFMAAMMDRNYRLRKENLALRDLENQALEMGKIIKALVHKYTNVNTHDLYKKGKE